jgi:hypothetical protein
MARITGYYTRWKEHDNTEVWSPEQENILLSESNIGIANQPKPDIF